MVGRACEPEDPTGNRPHPARPLRCGGEPPEGVDGRARPQGAALARIVLVSIWEVTRKLMRVGKLALMVLVITSTDERWVAMSRWMPAARAICARRCPALSICLPATIIRSAAPSMMTTNIGIGSGT